MSVVLGDALLRMRPDWGGFDAEVKQGTSTAAAGAGKSSGDAYAKTFNENSSSKISNGFKKIAAAGIAFFASREILQGANAMVQRASDLSETGNKIGVVFGEADTMMKRFARGAVDTLGQTQQSALDAAATFGVFGKAAGLNDRENAKFSRSLVKLSSDMASFSNTTPEDAIAALGAGLRGESEPLRRYGVLLDDTTLKAEALSLGLLKPVKDQNKIKASYANVTIAQQNYNEAVREHGKESLEATKAEAALGTAQSTLKKATEGTIPPLTNQQKVLAAQSAIMKQTKDAQGDFARTSGGLANQTRILSAQSETLKTTIGKGLMPVWSTAARLMTSKVMPPLIQLADTWVPKVAKATRRWLREADPSAMLNRISGALRSIDWNSASNGASAIGEGFQGVDWATVSQRLSEIGGDLADLVPVLGEVAKSGASDALSVFGVVVGFAADHTDLLAKAMPILVGVLIAHRVAQLASNLATAASIPMKLTEIAVNRQLTTSNKALIASRAGDTAATTANTAAQSGGIVARTRAIATLVAQKAATIAAAAATKAATAGQWLMNAALTANPIGLVVVAIAGLVAGLVIAYKKSETFRRIVNAAFKGVLAAAQAVWGWIKGNWKTLLTILTGPIGVAVRMIARNWDTIKSGAAAVKNFITDRFGALVGFFKSIPGKISGGVTGMFDGIKTAFRTAVNWIIDKWNGLSFGLPQIDTKIPGIGKVGGFSVSPPDIPRLAVGGRVPGNRPTHVVIGDGREPESVLPDSMLQKALTGAAAAGAARASVAAGGDLLTATLVELLALLRQLAGPLRLVVGDEEFEAWLSSLADGRINRAADHRSMLDRMGRGGAYT